MAKLIETSQQNNARMTQAVDNLSHGSTASDADIEYFATPSKNHPAHFKMDHSNKTSSELIDEEEDG